MNQLHDELLSGLKAGEAAMLWVFVLNLLICSLCFAYLAFGRSCLSSFLFVTFALACL